MDIVYHCTIVNDISTGGVRVSTRVCGITVDRDALQGYITKDMKTAERLAVAIEAGAVFHDPQVRTDINGLTFLSVRSRVLGRTMNADLKRLGY